MHFKSLLSNHLSFREQSTQIEIGMDGDALCERRERGEKKQRDKSVTESNSSKEQEAPRAFCMSV